MLPEDVRGSPVGRRSFVCDDAAAAVAEFCRAQVV